MVEWACNVTLILSFLLILQHFLAFFYSKTFSLFPAVLVPHYGIFNWTVTFRLGSYFWVGCYFQELLERKFENLKINVTFA